MSKKNRLKLSKADEKLIDAAIKKVGQGPKEQPRPRRRGSRLGSSGAPRPIDETPMQPFDGWIVPPSAIIERPDDLIVVPEVTGPLWAHLSDTPFELPTATVTQVTMTREQYEAELQLAERLTAWFPRSIISDFGINSLARTLRRRFNVQKMIQPMRDDWSTWAPVHEESHEWATYSICFHLFDDIDPRTLFPKAYEVPIRTVLSWLVRAESRQEVEIDWTIYNHHDCFIS